MSNIRSINSDEELAELPFESVVVDNHGSPAIKNADGSWRYSDGSVSSSPGVPVALVFVPGEGNQAPIDPAQQYEDLFEGIFAKVYNLVEGYVKGSNDAKKVTTDITIAILDVVYENLPTSGRALEKEEEDEEYNKIVDKVQLLVARLMAPYVDSLVDEIDFRITDSALEVVYDNLPIVE